LSYRKRNTTERYTTKIERIQTQTHTSVKAEQTHTSAELWTYIQDENAIFMRDVRENFPSLCECACVCVCV